MTVWASLVLGRGEWLLPALLIAAAAAVVLAWLYRRSALEPRVRLAALGCKVAAVAMLAFCLAEPLWSSQRVRPGANLFLLVADNSRSLTLRDGEDAETRGEGLRRLLTEQEAPWLVRLEQDFEVRRYTCDGQLKYVTDFHALRFDGDRSNLGGMLRSLRERMKDRPVAGVLLYTDGVSTDAVADADLAGLPPIYVVPIGSGSHHRDLAIANVAATTTAFEDAPVTLQAEVAALGLAKTPVTVQVLDAADKEVRRETQRLNAAGDPLMFRFQLRPERAGVTFYKLRAVPSDQPDGADAVAETTTVNNERLVAVDRGTGPYRVLYVSGRPNWEYKFIRRAVEADDQLQLTAIVRIAKREAKFDFRGRDGESSNPLFRGFDKTGEDTERYDQPVLVRLNTKSPEELRDGFPKTPEGLYRYHAVILDDVEAAFFTAEQLSLLERFVSERGGGLLMLGGQESFQPGKYERTAVARMLPVYIDVEPSLPPTQGYRLALTREGWLQPWARLRSTEAEEVRRLREMASFRTAHNVRGLKPGATVVAETIDPRGQKQPAIVMQRFGQGRCGAVLVGDLWRWQLEQTDEQRKQDDLGKAWRQLLRWLVVDVPDRVELVAHAQESLGEPLVRLEARIRNADFHAQDNAAVHVTVTPPEGAPLTLPAEASLKEPGLYEAVVAGRPAGAWRAQVEVADADGKPVGQAAAGWVADALAGEFQRVAPHRELLERIARGTGGEVVDVRDLPALAEKLPSRKAPLTEATTTPLWHSPFVWLWVVVGLCAEWALRRRRGLP